MPLIRDRDGNTGNVPLVLCWLMFLWKFERNKDLCVGEQREVVRSGAGFTASTLQYFTPFKEMQ